MNLCFTMFEAIDEPRKYRVYDKTFTEFAQAFGSVVVMPPERGRIDAKKNRSPAATPQFIPGELVGARRADNGMRSISAVVLDLDEAPPQIIEALFRRLRREDIAFWGHTSWNHKPEAPRWRVIIPLDRPLRRTTQEVADCEKHKDAKFGRSKADFEEHYAVRRALRKRFPEASFTDTATDDPSRQFTLVVVRSDREHEFRTESHLTGKHLSTDEMLKLGRSIANTKRFARRQVTPAAPGIVRLTRESLEHLTETVKARYPQHKNVIRLKAMLAGLSYSKPGEEAQKVLFSLGMFIGENMPQLTPDYNLIVADVWDLFEESFEKRAVVYPEGATTPEKGAELLAEKIMRGLPR